MKWIEIKVAFEPQQRFHSTDNGRKRRKRQRFIRVRLWNVLTGFNLLMELPQCMTLTEISALVLELVMGLKAIHYQPFAKMEVPTF